DELAAEQLIIVNTAVKPYSRLQIAKYLELAKSQNDKLNPRQKGELNFFLQDYNKELRRSKDFDKRFDAFYYKDSLFTFSLNPVVGVDAVFNKSNLVYNRWIGGEIFGYIGKHFGFYANLRDHHENEPLLLNTYITDKSRANYRNGNEYSEMRGGVTWSWKWGSIGLIKDHFSWGNGYNGSNIFSGRTPSFPYLNLKLQPVKWLNFNYVHAWLVSEVIDSLRSYQFSNGTRQVMRPKYLASNFLTIFPNKKINFSVGNSVVYSDVGIYPAYLIPVFFYKSIDHSTGSSNYIGQNAQMFFDISYRPFRKVHSYVSLFLDEIGLNRMFDRAAHSNFYSFKGGIKISNIIYKTSILIEYTRTNPATYSHFIPTTTFESNLYNLGHYLGDNAREWYVKFTYKPLKQVKINVSYLYAQVGTQYEYTTGYDVWGLPFLDNIEWSNNLLSIETHYQMTNDIFARVGFKSAKIFGEKKNVYTPSILQGNYFFSSLNFDF
ncbi:MAG: hypothetical protein JKY33_08635, partial [Bacteroidia bacterium]|nr:hypothetical protein [Bacteroidia bacterium]